MDVTRSSGSCVEHVLATVLGEHRDEAHVAAVVTLALLEHPPRLALDPRPQVVGTAFGEEEVAALAQAGQAVLEHRVDEPFLRAEVVLHRRVVAVAGGRADLAERDALDAVLREEPLRGQHDLFLGRGGDHRHGRCRIPPPWTAKVNRLRVKTFRERPRTGDETA